MPITTLISWYDERPDWLAEAVKSVSTFSDQVIALDGSYGLYPNPCRKSPYEQARAIRETACEFKMGCTIVEPTKPWGGNEIHKRSTLFAIAECLTSENDWYFVLDSDEIVMTCPYHNLADILSKTNEDVGEVMVWEKSEFNRPFPKLFRAIKGIRVVGNHWTYELPDGRRLWGHGHRGKVLEPSANFHMMRVRHRSDRDAQREQDAQTYYQHRDIGGAERDP